MDAAEANKRDRSKEQLERGAPMGWPAGTTKEDRACWVCGGRTSYRHCKIICDRCGFTRDCSDP